MKEIPLTQGKVVLVDDEDYDWINKFSWYVRKGRYCFYATRTKYFKGGKRRLYIHERYQMHRIIMERHGDFKKIPPKVHVVHLNRNGLDNRKSNLRLGTGESQKCMIKTKPHSSIFKGVHWDKQNKKWFAQITCDYKNYFLGRYIDEVEAAKAYDVKAKELFGEFACLNFKGAA